MKTRIKNWACALLLPLLLLALLLYFNVERRYAEADITPELCAKLVSHELKHWDSAPKPEDVQILGIQKVDDIIFAGYCVKTAWDMEPNFGYLEFWPYKDVYRLWHCHTHAIKLTPQIAGEILHPDYSGPAYWLIMSLDEEFRRVELWCRQSESYDDETDSYILWDSIDIPSGPVMVISQRPSGAMSGKLLILDAERREIVRR